MEYMCIANYSINKSTFQEIADAAKAGLLPEFGEQTGFLRYGLADLADGTCLSISTWITREDAVAAESVAATWTRENLGDKVVLRSSRIANLAFLEGVPATV